MRSVSGQSGDEMRRGEHALDSGSLLVDRTTSTPPAFSTEAFQAKKQSATKLEESIRSRLEHYIIDRCCEAWILAIRRKCADRLPVPGTVGQPGLRIGWWRLSTAFDSTRWTGAGHRALHAALQANGT